MQTGSTTSAAGKSQKPPAAGVQRAASRPNSVESVDALSAFTRSLLQIKIPVTVTLASKRLALGQIVELGLGSIVQFEKPCDQVLQLEAAGQPIAEGAAVKIGEKFGLRITALVLPGERFKKIGGGE